jgi:hypothetical protein
MPREVDADHGNIQRRATSMAINPMARGCPRWRARPCRAGQRRGARGEVILGKAQVIQAPQQWLAEFIRRQHGHAHAHLLRQRGQRLQDRQRLHRRVVLGGDPQRRFEQRRRRALQAGEKGFAGFIAFSGGCSRFSLAGNFRPVA